MPVEHVDSPTSPRVASADAQRLMALLIEMDERLSAAHFATQSIADAAAGASDPMLRLIDATAIGACDHLHRAWDAYEAMQSIARRLAGYEA